MTVEDKIRSAEKMILEEKFRLFVTEGPDCRGMFMEKPECEGCATAEACEVAKEVDEEFALYMAEEKAPGPVETAEMPIHRR